MDLGGAGRGTDKPARRHGLPRVPAPPGAALGPMAHQHLTLGPDQGREPGQASRGPWSRGSGRAGGALARLLASQCVSSWRTEGCDLPVAPAPRSSLEVFQWPQLPSEVHRAPQAGLLASRASGLADWTVSLVCDPGRMCKRPAGHRVRLQCGRCV